jgi:hypothetical protein
MEAKINFYSIVIIFLLFVFASITPIQMANIFENVQAQQQPRGSLQSSSVDRIPEVEHRSIADRISDDQLSSIEDRIPDGNPRSSEERYSQYNEEDIVRHIEHLKLN